MFVTFDGNDVGGIAHTSAEREQQRAADRGPPPHKWLSRASKNGTPPFRLEMKLDGELQIP